LSVSPAASRLSLLPLLLLAPLGLHAQERPPILDVHLHAGAADSQGPPPLGMCTPIESFPVMDSRISYQETFLSLFKEPACPDPVWSPMTDQELMEETLEVLERLNIIGVVSGPPEYVAAWREHAPHRLIPGLVFAMDQSTPSPEDLRELHARGELAVLGEVITQYQGILPGDDRLAPYWALAEELDIPVGIHVGTGPPGVIYLGAAGYRAHLHSPLTMEEVLVRHPRLRVYLMHAGYPMLDDLLALLYAHPQVHVDVGVIVFTQPRAAFYRFLEGVVEAGFGNRIMFGSDQMVWPGVIERSIAVIQDAPFLSAEQKRDILYNNAARFLGLTSEEIARHHGME
jgi:uncharacterized protein